MTKTEDMKQIKPIVRVRDLIKAFPMKVDGKKRMVNVVEGISFDIAAGESLGLVGESGCGKTTVGRTIIHLYDPSGGTIEFDGVPVTRENARDLARDMQMVFQDPYTSLDPRMTIGDVVAEPLRVQKIGTRAEQHERVVQALSLVGLGPEVVQRYPYALSGGQRQRVAIARTLVCNPRFIVCDEAVSALDVSVQAQVLNILVDLQKRLGISYLFISHDLAVVRHLCQRIAVMYLGRIVEIGETDEIFANPLHPYTEVLLSSIPVPDPKQARASNRVRIEGELPGLAHLPEGCVFSTRCPYATSRCHQERPVLTEAQTGHSCACLRHAELSLVGMGEVASSARAS